MKWNRKAKCALGLSAFFAAVALTFTFIVNAIRKKSLWQAFLALLSAESAAGAAVYLCHVTGKKCRNGAKNGDDGQLDAVDESTCPADEELFDDAGCHEAAARIRHVFAAKRDGVAAPSLRREIPRDEEATEADFQ